MISISVTRPTASSCVQLLRRPVASPLRWWLLAVWFWIINPCRSPPCTLAVAVDRLALRRKWDCPLRLTRISLPIVNIAAGIRSVGHRIFLHTRLNRCVLPMRPLAWRWFAALAGVLFPATTFLSRKTAIAFCSEASATDTALDSAKPEPEPWPSQEPVSERFCCTTIPIPTSSDIQPRTVPNKRSLADLPTLAEELGNIELARPNYA